MRCCALITCTHRRPASAVAAAAVDRDLPMRTTETDDVDEAAADGVVKPRALVTAGTLSETLTDDERTALRAARSAHEGARGVLTDRREARLDAIGEREALSVQTASRRELIVRRLIDVLRADCV
jgi:hypothetical protein